MAKIGQAPNPAKWRTWGAATLLVAAFAGFSDARTETLSGLEGVTANAPREILEPPAVSRDVTPARPRQASSLTGNPLWGVPLSALQETRARPLFSSSRRPPVPPVIAASSPPTPKPPPPREPDRLKLTLLGTVIRASDGIGLFMDETSKEVIRIRTGASHDGWTLRSVQRRAASFEKNHQETTLTLAPPASEPSAPSIGVAASRAGGAGISGNDHGAANLPDNRAPLPILPVSAPITQNAHKVRQDLLSIPVSN